MILIYDYIAEVILFCLSSGWHLKLLNSFCRLQQRCRCKESNDNGGRDAVLHDSTRRIENSGSTTHRFKKGSLLPGRLDCGWGDLNSCHYMARIQS